MNNIEPEEEIWRDKEYSFFSHKMCEAYPCHEAEDKDDFNCLFCYCPLYALGGECGGDFKYLSNGVKDCGSCLIPHVRDNYGDIIGKFDDIVKKMKETAICADKGQKQGDQQSRE